MSGSAEGEVERKVRELGDEVFAKYGGNDAINAEGKPYIRKEHLKEFIKNLITSSDELKGAWNE